MKLKIVLSVILMLHLGSTFTCLQAQVAIPASGGNATGTGGTVSYSVGQVFYTINTGTTGFIVQGVQQPFEISHPAGKTQIISFTAGWNLFSFNTLPANLDMKVIFQPLIDAGKLVKVQDETGTALEDYGILGGWVNNIGNISLTEGYKVKVTGNCLLTLEGSGIAYPFNIPLKTGWNIIGFPYDSQVDGKVVIQQLIDRGSLIKVQNETGDAIEDYGVLGGWVNNIGNFMPGEGYKVKVTGTETLTINESYPKAANIVRRKINTVHFHSAAEGNGVDHMNINLVGLQPGIWQIGDEIGVFDGNLCVGAMVIGNQYSVFGPSIDGSGISNQKSQIRNRTSEIRNLSIAASAYDGMDGAGFTEGRPFILRLWKKESGNEYLVEPEIIKGTSTFVKHESTLASVRNFGITGIEKLCLPETRKIQCYPNPTPGKVHLILSDFPQDGIQVQVINSLGQMISTGMIYAEPATIDLSGNVSGVYYLKITSNRWYQTERIILK